MRKDLSGKNSAEGKSGNKKQRTLSCQNKQKLFQKGAKSRKDIKTKIYGAGEYSEDRKKRSPDSLHGEFD